MRSRDAFHPDDVYLRRCTDLSTLLLAAFLRAVFASLRRRARECYGVRRAKSGSVTISRVPIR